MKIASLKNLKIKLSSDQNGSTLLVAILSILVLTLGGLSGWALYSYSQERNTVDEQVAEAVEEARSEQRQEDEERFEEERQNPYRTYTAPDVFGAIELELPKNWNIYAEDATSSSIQIDLYIHPDMVRSQNNVERPYAFRMQLLDNLYQDTVDDYQRSVEQGEVDSRTATVSGIDGVRLSGAITSTQSGEMVVLPYRDKTIQIWTEGDSYTSQFNKMIERAEISR